MRIRDYPLVSSIVIGVIAGTTALALRSSLRKEGSGDFYQSCRLARDLLHGTDPYRHPLDEWYMPSPLPTGFLCVPLIRHASAKTSGALFFGASTTLLAWGILRRQPVWRLLCLFSWPYVYAAINYQWTPLAMSLAYVPLALPVMLMKPQCAAPLVLSRLPSKGGIVFTCIVLAVSLVVYPTWPWVWFNQAVGSGAYEGFVPILMFPVGLALAVAPLFALRWEGRVLTWMSVLPQRVYYDQLLLFALPRTRAGMVALVATSWAGVVWYVIRGDWRWWVMWSLYMPALSILAWENRDAVPELFARVWRCVRSVAR